mgnify:CR=1 FL=1
MEEESFQVPARKHTKRFTYYTGLPSVQLFLVILHHINEYLDTIWIQKLTNFQKLLIVLIKLRWNVDYCDLSYWFGVRISSISDLFKKVIVCLEHTFSDFIHWPDQAVLKAAMPTEFKICFGDKVCAIIDCFEIKIQRPTMLNT